MCIVELVFFFVNDTATTEIYTYCHTLSLHDALPICWWSAPRRRKRFGRLPASRRRPPRRSGRSWSKIWSSSPYSRNSGTLRISGYARRSEEHTSELQSLMRISYAVFCLKKKKTQQQIKNNNIAQICRPT